MWDGCLGGIDDVASVDDRGPPNTLEAGGFYQHASTSKANLIVRKVVAVKPFTNILRPSVGQ